MNTSKDRHLEHLELELDVIKKQRDALLKHMAESVDKDNDWGPCEWEAWNTKAKALTAGHNIE